MCGLRRGDAGGLGEGGLDLGADRALRARGDQRLGEPVDMYVGAPAVAALGWVERDESEDAVGPDELAVTERDQTRLTLGRHRRQAYRRLFLGRRIELVELLLRLLAALRGEDRDAADPGVALAAGDHEAELVLVLGCADLARVVEQLLRYLAEQVAVDRARSRSARG